jgi:hypothetical protein
MISRIAVVLAFLATAMSIRAATPQWRHLSTTTGNLPLPGTSTEQTGALIGDFDRDGKNDFIISFRKTGPALVWYRRTDSGWARHVIEPDYLTVEAGGAMADIDGDGDPDVVFGGDWQSDEVWWWENPSPTFDPGVPWKRHTIKRGGAKQHHDQVFGDFLGTGKPQLAFWNQGAKKLFLAEIPADPRRADSWPLTEIFSGAAGEGGRKTEFVYAEGVAACDVDGDGQVDLLAGNLWFKHRGGTKFDAIPIGKIGGRVAAGKLKPGKYPQVIIAPGDGNGPLCEYECVGDPEKTSDWIGHELLDREMIHGHSLQIADIDGDGNSDIFAAEMAKWKNGKEADNPNATAWILYGDGKGNFRKAVFQSGVGFHEARVADLDGDGRMDILSKPYTWMTPRLDVWLQIPPTTSGRGSSDLGSLIWPGKTWETQSPEEAGLSAAHLAEAAAYAGGRGCIVRHGRIVYTWGDPTQRGDVASAAKPVYGYFLFKALETGRVAALDDRAVAYEPRLAGLNAALGYKDRDITLRELATQTSCYGVSERPGTAFDYNDFQMALFWDVLFTKIYGANYQSVDEGVLRPLLTGPLECEDTPTLLAFGEANRPGRLAISPRDYARFGLLYLRHGKWRDQQLLSPGHVKLAVGSPLPSDFPRTSAREAEMIAGQRTIGATVKPDDQTDHRGSYSWLWWINGVDRHGKRFWPGVPEDVFAALGHANGQRGLAVMPSLDLVVAWNDTVFGQLPEEPYPPDEFFRRIVAAVEK